MKLHHFALAAAGSLVISTAAAQAATLTFAAGTGVALAFNTGNYKTCGVGESGSDCYDPTSPASSLMEDLLTFDSATPGPGLLVDTEARITVEFLGKEAGAINTAFSVAGGSVTNLDLVGSTYSTIVAAGTLDFAFSSMVSGGTLAANDGTFVGTAAMGFSAISKDGTSVYAFFDDSGASNDRDYDDMVVKITVSPVPIPASGILLLAGLGGLAALRRRKKA